MLWFVPIELDEISYAILISVKKKELEKNPHEYLMISDFRQNHSIINNNEINRV